MVDSEADDTEWSKNVVRITEFAQETAGSFASQYNETAWFPVARETFSRFMEVWASGKECSLVNLNSLKHPRFRPS